MDSLVEKKKKLELRAFFVAKTPYLVRVRMVGDSFAEIVDAENVAGEELTPFLRQKKAAGRVKAFCWEADIQQQIDEQQKTGIMILQAGATA